MFLHCSSFFLIFFVFYFYLFFFFLVHFVEAQNLICWASITSWFLLPYLFKKSIFRAVSGGTRLRPLFFFFFGCSKSDFFLPQLLHDFSQHVFNFFFWAVSGCTFSGFFSFWSFFYGSGRQTYRIWGICGRAGTDLRRLIADQHPSLDGYEEIGESWDGARKRVRASERADPEALIDFFFKKKEKP